MIDGYRDPFDWQRWRDADSEAQRERVRKDPRYYAGQLYSTIIDRNAAEARDRLAQQLERDVNRHKLEIRAWISMDSFWSAFNNNGVHKSLIERTL